MCQKLYDELFGVMGYEIQMTINGAKYKRQHYISAIVFHNLLLSVVR